MTRLPSLDGLRACAVALVFLAHSGLDTVVPGGLGVTLFFVISGYLITSLLHAEFASRGRLDLPRFYARRALRLMPPLLLVIGVAAVLAHLGVIGGRFTPGGLASALLHFSNYYLIRHDFAGMPAGLGALWSLSVEEHFYLLFPPLLAVALRIWPPRRLAAILAGLCAAMLVWRIWLNSRGGQELWLMMATDTRADAILAGCILALLVAPDADAERATDSGGLHRLPTVGVVACLTLLLGTLLWRNEGFRQTWRYSLQAVALLPLVHLAVTRPDSRWFRWLEHPALKWIGQRSYAIYLVHHVMLEGLSRHWPTADAFTVAAIGAGATLLVAQAMQRFVETPLARWRKYWRVDPAQKASPPFPALAPGNIRVSICIATYRRPQKLAALIEDLARQERLPDEVVVVDNDHQESARAAIIHCQQAGLPFPLIHAVQPEQNISLTRNRTVTLASGDWLAFIDDDERAPPDWLARLLDCAAIWRADGVLGPVLPRLPAEASAWIRRGGFHDWPRMATGTVVPPNRLRFGNVLLKAALLEVQPGPFDEKLGLTGGEDGDLLNRLRLSGARLVWCDEAFVEEPVDPSRLRLGWLWRRALRGGQDHARHLLHGRYGRRGIVAKAAYFLRAVLQALLAAALALLTFAALPHQGIRWWLRATANLGKLSVLVGRHHREYAEPRA